MVSIVVIGGGVVGLSCAISLAREGNSVTLIEGSARDRAASWGNAGHIATEQTAPLASAAMLRSLPKRLFTMGGPLSLPLKQIGAWAPFAAQLVAAAAPQRFAAGRESLKALLTRALPAWRTLDESLGGGLLIEDGHMVAWESAVTAARGRAAWQEQDIGTASFEDTAAPPFGAALHAIRFEGTAQIRDLTCLADALELEALANGVKLVAGTASVHCNGTRAEVPGHDGDLVLVAAGVHSGALLQPTGHRVPIVAERGYHVRGAADRWPAGLPPIVFEDRSIIVTRYSDCVQVAGFVELSKVDAPPDPRKWRRLERHARELDLPMSRPFSHWMGARPTLPDYLPAIGRSHRTRNLLYAFGHQHLGLTLAPITARLITELVSGIVPDVDLTPFSLRRFER